MSPPAKIGWRMETQMTISSLYTAMPARNKADLLLRVPSRSGTKRSRASAGKVRAATLNPTQNLHPPPHSQGCHECSEGNCRVCAIRKRSPLLSSTHDLNLRSNIRQALVGCDLRIKSWAETVANDHRWCKPGMRSTGADISPKRGVT